MKSQTVNVVKAIVRFFISSFNRGNTITANTATIHADVCRQLHITKQANKNNYRGIVTEALRILKRRVVLFETITPKENDLLNRAVSIDNRTVYGLTAAIEEYVTRPHTDTTSVTSDRYIYELLQHFGVLSTPTTPVAAPVPEEQKEMADNNVARIISTIRQESITWRAKVTPADLLGAMYALHTADVNNPPAENAGMLSMARLSWPVSLAHNYHDCYKVLERAGLITPYKTQQHRTKTGDMATRPYGFKFTPLGIEVAIGGEFKDTRSAAQKTSPSSQKKAGRMLKRAVSRTNRDVEEELQSYVHTEAFKQAVAAEVALLMQAERAALGLPTPTVAPPEEWPRPVAHDDLTTMSIMLERAVPAIIESFSGLVDPPDTTNPRTAINVRGVYLALTEIEKAVKGLKSYLATNDSHGDGFLPLLQQYSASYRTAAAELEKKLRLPVLGDTIPTGARRVLRGDKAISHPLFGNTVTAQT
jgi:hypothetical protein